VLLRVWQTQSVKPAAAQKIIAKSAAMRPQKNLVILPGGHFDAYVGNGFKMASAAACEWFMQHL
jgi:hypothetical protein